MLKGTSRFGAELDSLADFVNFGVAPALMLYFWGLHELGNAGWIAAMVFAISTGLRLARFNVMADDPNKPAWAANFFVGVPAPAGAITVLLPIYVYFLGMPRVVFVHGSVGNGDASWREQWPLAEELELVVLNRPGFPPGPPVERIDFEDHADWVAERCGPVTTCAGTPTAASSRSMRPCASRRSVP